jgi:hypothetical protein
MQLARADASQLIVGGAGSGYSRGLSPCRRQQDDLGTRCRVPGERPPDQDGRVPGVSEQGKQPRGHKLDNRRVC